MTIHKIELIALFPLRQTPLREINVFESAAESEIDCAERFMIWAGTNICMLRSWHPDDEPGLVWEVRAMYDGQSRHVGDFLDTPAKAQPTAAESAGRSQRQLMRCITGGK